MKIHLKVTEDNWNGKGDLLTSPEWVVNQDGLSDVTVLQHLNRIRRDIVAFIASNHPDPATRSQVQQVLDSMPAPTV